VDAAEHECGPAGVRILSHDSTVMNTHYVTLFGLWVYDITCLNLANNKPDDVKKIRRKFLYFMNNVEMSS